MTQSIGAMIKQLQQMTVGELRKKWEEVFGEPARSHNKAYLWKRIAWRIQVNMEGGLSERARQRIKEIAREADIRLRPPKGAFEGTPGGTVGRKRDRRLPAPGTVITRQYRDQEVSVTVLENGFEYEGRPYRSLSAITKAVTGSHWNGYHFFGLNGRKGARAAG